MRAARFELARDCSRQALNLVRLPIPPRSQAHLWDAAEPADALNSAHTDHTFSRNF